MALTCARLQLLSVRQIENAVPGGWEVMLLETYRNYLSHSLIYLDDHNPLGLHKQALVGAVQIAHAFVWERAGSAAGDY